MSAAAESLNPIVQKTMVGLEAYLSPSGSLNTPEMLDELAASFSSCIDDDYRKVAIDMAAVKLIDSQSLESLLDFQDRLRGLGGRLKIVNPNTTLRDVLRVTELDQQISVAFDAESEDSEHDTLDDADKPSLGELLVSQGLVTESQVEKALELQRTSGQRLGEIVVDQGWVPEQQVLQALSSQLSVPFVNLRVGLFDAAIGELIGKSVARRLCVYPMFKIRDVIYLATTKPQDLPVLTEVKERLQCAVRPILARRDDIIKAIEDTQSGDEWSTELIDDMLDEDLEVVEAYRPEDDFTAIDEAAGGSPIVNLVNSLIQRAVKDGASDVHIEPFRTRSRIRFRIDGLLYEIMSPKSDLHAAIVSRLKVMANLDIAERRLPQDGRIQVVTQGRNVDLRFSSLPGLHGEKVVLRVLDKNQAILDVEKLGMSVENLAAYKRQLSQGFGLILVTGPTGSGKTTSLYAALNYLNSIEKNIVTIEDPVEYQIDIINQNEVRERVGLTFAKVLKHVLRQDPDIVMVGEIRERETAEIAVQAALTGHLVLSTLHTNDSTGAITRMIDMGVEPYLLSSALIGVVAQRLVRTICPACKTTYIARKELAAQHGWEQGTRLAKGRGCTECYDSGYRGRLGIHEVLEMTQSLQQLIIENPSRDQLTAFMTESESRTLFDDGLTRVLEEKTTIEEVSRVINT